MSSNKLEMVKCEKFTNKCVPNKHTEKSLNFPVTGESRYSGIGNCKSLSFEKYSLPSDPDISGRI